MSSLGMTSLGSHIITSVWLQLHDPMIGLNQFIRPILDPTDAAYLIFTHVQGMNGCLERG